MSPDELRSAVASGAVDTVVVAFTDHYGRPLGKRLDATFFLDRIVTDGMHACDYLLTADMEMAPVAGYEVASWDLGYGDFHLVPDMATLRPAAWAPGTVWVIADALDVASHERVAVAPRSVLRRQVEQLTALGYTAQAASELEFFVYRTSFRDAFEQGYTGLEHAGWYIEDYHLLQGARIEDYVGAVRRALRESEIPVEGSKGEWGRGQHELNIAHADVLDMAARHVLVKQAMKEIADGMGISVTFMAKPHADEAGSSCHLHVSLLEGGRPTFAGADGSPTDVFRWFLGGWMAHVRDFMVCYAPTVNSYKRYRAGSWAPSRVAWARDNRTAGFRVVGTGDDLRIECRIPGADVHPDLAYAATLASGRLGIEQRIEPPDEVAGDNYRAAGLPVVPGSLREAVDAFRVSAVARDAFGDAVVDHYAHFHDVELAAFDAAVTDWERVRYFERI